MSNINDSSSKQFIENYASTNYPSITKTDNLRPWEAYFDKAKADELENNKGTITTTHALDSDNIKYRHLSSYNNCFEGLDIPDKYKEYTANDIKLPNVKVSDTTIKKDETDALKKNFDEIAKDLPNFDTITTNSTLHHTYDIAKEYGLDIDTAIEDYYVKGTGSFDTLMETVTKHLTAQYLSNKIKGEDYARTYSAVMQTVIQVSMQIQASKIEKYIQFLNAKIGYITQLAQIRLKEKELEITGQQGNSKLLSEMEKDNRQLEIALSTSKEQNKLYARQRRGFNENSQKEFLKTATDLWNIGYSVGGISGEFSPPRWVQSDNIDRIAFEIYRGIGLTNIAPGEVNSALSTEDKIKEASKYPNLYGWGYTFPDYPIDETVPGKDDDK